MSCHELVRTISRAHILELTPQQKQVLDSIHDSFLNWCTQLGIEPVNPEKLTRAFIPLDPAM